MVKVIPGAMPMVPYRSFRAAVQRHCERQTAAAPAPAPYAGAVIVIQLALLVPFHGHALWFCPGSAIIPTDAGPPLLPKFFVVANVRL